MLGGSPRAERAATTSTRRSWDEEAGGGVGEADLGSGLGASTSRTDGSPSPSSAASTTDAASSTAAAAASAARATSNVFEGSPAMEMRKSARKP